MLIGYARVSTQDQETAAQIAALKTAGCELIFQEKASGGRWDRPELHRLLGQLRKDDVLVVWKLDRLSRLLKDVLSLMEKIAQAQAGFRSLSEAIDTRPAWGATPQAQARPAGRNCQPDSHGSENRTSTSSALQRPSRDHLTSFAAQQNFLTVLCVPLRPKPRLLTATKMIVQP